LIIALAGYDNNPHKNSSGRRRTTKKWNRELLDKKNKMTASGFVTSF
jgi:hypothetical protein